MFHLIFGSIILFSLLNQPTVPLPVPSTLAHEQYSLADRYANPSVNSVFSDNILLTIAYARGVVHKGTPVDWARVREPFTYAITLQPGHVFAFHDAVLDQYKAASLVTMGSHFSSDEGFRSDGWLVGDGVCHLASFLSMAAHAAGLEVNAPTRHDFAKIADVPAQYGVAIFYTPDNLAASSQQNLYITNTKDQPISLVFRHQNDTLDISVVLAYAN